MDVLPNFTRPEEFNRVLIYLADAGAELSKLALLDMLKSTTCQGLLPDHSETVSAAIGARFISSLSDRLSLTPAGQNFLALNPEGLYELAPGQSGFLYRNLIQRPPYSEITLSFFSLFRSRGKERSFSLDLSSLVLSADQGRLISLLRRLGVIYISRGIAVVTKEYQPQISAVRARRRLSLDELEALLLQQKMRGNAAELAVVEMERHRLCAAGFPIEAAAVALISDVDVAAGYDIESFNGGSVALEPDRFIEVKSTASSEGRFFWSQNELATAQYLGDRYWIYHLRAFSLDDPGSAACVLINDPAAMVENGVLSLGCAQYQAIFDIDEIPYSGYTCPFILK